MLPEQFWFGPKEMGSLKQLSYRTTSGLYLKRPRWRSILAAPLIHTGTVLLTVAIFILREKP